MEDGWDRFVDPTSGAAYRVERSTQRTEWESAGNEGVGGEGRPGSRPRASSPGPPVNGPWQRSVDSIGEAGGVTTMYNVGTGQWYQGIAATPQGEAAPSKSKWEKFTDTATGEVMLFNPISERMIPLSTLHHRGTMAFKPTGGPKGGPKGAAGRPSSKDALDRHRRLSSDVKARRGKMVSHRSSSGRNVRLDGAGKAIRSASYRIFDLL